MPATETNQKRKKIRLRAQQNKLNQKGGYKKTNTFKRLLTIEKNHALEAKNCNYYIPAVSPST